MLALKNYKKRKQIIKIVDELDSYNAIINEEQCVNCDLCRKVCQNNRNVKFTQPIMWKQGWARDTLVRSSSSSGGVAQAIERAFVRTGGIVCSCAFEKGTFGFMFAESEKEVEKFKGSKYVKSNPSGIYKKIKEYLIAGRKVLFVGLPCQVEAVKCYVASARGLSPPPSCSYHSSNTYWEQKIVEDFLRLL